METVRSADSEPPIVPSDDLYIIEEIPPCQISIAEYNSDDFDSDDNYICSPFSKKTRISLEPSSEILQNLFLASYISDVKCFDYGLQKNENLHL